MFKTHLFHSKVKIIIMSYDISLQDPVTRETIQLYLIPIECVFNYGEIYRRVFGDENVELSKFDKMFGGGETGIRKIYGMTGGDSIPVIEKVIAMLGNDVDEDYWKATEGNAKRALLQLVALAKMRPDGVWDGD